MRVYVEKLEFVFGQDLLHALTHKCLVAMSGAKAIGGYRELPASCGTIAAFRQPYPPRPLAEETLMRINASPDLSANGSVCA